MVFAVTYHKKWLMHIQGLDMLAKHRIAHGTNHNGSIKLLHFSGFDKATTQDLGEILHDEVVHRPTAAVFTEDKAIYFINAEKTLVGFSLKDGNNRGMDRLTIQGYQVIHRVGYLQNLFRCPHHALYPGSYIFDKDRWNNPDTFELGFCRVIEISASDWYVRI